MKNRCRVPVKLGGRNRQQEAVRKLHSLVSVIWILHFWLSASCRLLLLPFVSGISLIKFSAGT